MNAVRVRHTVRLRTCKSEGRATKARRSRGHTTTHWSAHRCTHPGWSHRHRCSASSFVAVRHAHRRGSHARRSRCRAAHSRRSERSTTRSSASSRRTPAAEGGHTWMTRCRSTKSLLLFQLVAISRLESVAELHHARTLGVKQTVSPRFDFDGLSRVRRAGQSSCFEIKLKGFTYPSLNLPSSFGSSTQERQLHPTRMFLVKTETIS